MASIKFITKGKKTPSNLYLRFYHSKTFDITIKSGILINPSHWNNKLQRFKNIAEQIPDKEYITKRLIELKEHIISTYNKSYKDGELISRQWLQNNIDKFNNRPTDGDDYNVYFTSFIAKWIEESRTRINPNTGKQIDIKTIRKYKTTLKRLKEFEEKYQLRLKHIDIGLNFHQKFVSFLSIEGNYGSTTIEKYISQVKTFCREVEISGYKINPEFKSRRFTFRRQKPLDPYLTVEEINKIYNLKIEDHRLDNIRDLFIIGLWTGLRVSDFKQLQRMNIVGNNIIVASTKKTGKPATIPIHHQVKEILDKRNGDLPSLDLSKKSFEHLFNKCIKVIAKLAGITQPILGDKRDPDLNRGVRGIYPKYELISSHICRRSFVSNHYGKISNQAIMAITTHSSEKQLLDYVKISNEEHIEDVRRYWEKQQSLLKVV